MHRGYQTEYERNHGKMSLHSSMTSGRRQNIPLAPEQNYGDVLEMYTGCSEEYKHVLSLMENLEIALKDLSKKAMKEDQNLSLISSIMHKELVNSIYSELQKLSIGLRKSKFFGKLLNTSVWKKTFKEHIDRSVKSTSVGPVSRSSVYGSEYGINKVRKYENNDFKRQVFKPKKEKKGLKRHFNTEAHDKHKQELVFKEEIKPSSFREMKLRKKEPSTKRDRSKSVVS